MELDKKLKGGLVKELPKNHSILNLFKNTEDTLDLISVSGLEELELDLLAQNGMAGPGKKNLSIYQTVENFSITNDVPLLIRELPAIRHTETTDWWRFSWNHYFLDKGIYPYDDAYDRWTELKSRLDIKIYNWRSLGEKILFILQKPLDSALNKLHVDQISYESYCIDVIKKIKEHTDRSIVLRKHPRDPSTLIRRLGEIFSDIEISQNRSLLEDFNDSHCVVTYNSTSSVESVFYGIPTICLDSSCVATDVSHHSLKDIENLVEFDRSDWLKKLAYMQWSPEEILSGKTWSFVKDCFPK
jgi:hypothetical protein